MIHAAAALTALGFVLAVVWAWFGKERPRPRLKTAAVVCFAASLVLIFIHLATGGTQ